MIATRAAPAARAGVVLSASGPASATAAPAAPERLTNSRREMRAPSGCSRSSSTSIPSADACWCSRASACTARINGVLAMYPSLGSDDSLTLVHSARCRNPWRPGEDDEERDERQVAHEHDGSTVEVQRVVPVVLREPHLREYERHGEERRRRDSAATADERHERDQPEQELRREHLAEGDERAYARRAVANEALGRDRPARERDPHEHERRELQHSEHRRHRAVAGDVLRAVGGDDLRVAEGCEERRAETLDLERPRGLPAQALPDAVRREHGERDERERGDGETGERCGQTARPPRPDQREGHEHDRPELRPDNRAEQGPTEP